MKATHKQSLLATALAGLLAFTTMTRAGDPELKNEASVALPPRLILQITVDQLRGDLPERFVKQMGEGGFRYLLNQGVW